MSQKGLAGILLLTGALLVGAVVFDSVNSEDKKDSPQNSGDDSQNSTSNNSGNYSGVDHELATECLESHSNLSQHFHPYLSLYVDGKQVAIEANAGIGTEVCDGMHVVHTHDSSGKLHVETHEPAEVVLGVFFQILDVYLDDDGIFDKRVNETHELVMSVDGVVVDTYEEHILSDAQQIVIEYRERAQG